MVIATLTSPFSISFSSSKRGNLPSPLKNAQILSTASSPDGNLYALTRGNRVINEILETESLFSIQTWTGNSWQTLGEGFTEPSYIHSLTISPEGRPVIAFFEAINRDPSRPTDYRHDLNLLVWDDTAWVPLLNDGTLTELIYSENDTRIITNLNIAFDSQGHPVIAFFANSTEFFAQDIYVKRWDGTTWRDVGGIINEFSRAEDSGFPVSSYLALGSNDRPSIVYSECTDKFQTACGSFVKQWQNDTWVTLEENNELKTFVGLYADQQNRLVIVRNTPEQTLTGNRHAVFYVERWDNASWQQIGGRLNEVDGFRSAAQLDLAFESNNNPVVAWERDTGDGGDNMLYLVRWHDEAWQLLPSPLESDEVRSYNPDITLDQQNRLTVAWQAELLEGKYTLRAKQLKLD